jgi:trans-aconitate 2-methyltransferase
MPNNRAEAAYRLLAELAAQPRWAGRLPAGELRPTIEPPEWYVSRHRALGLEADVWETIYYHQLPNPLAIVEWLKGTALRPILSALAQEETAEFLSDLGSGISKLYAAGPFGVVFPIRRLFFLGHRS